MSVLFALAAVAVFGLTIHMVCEALQEARTKRKSGSARWAAHITWLAFFVGLTGLRISLRLCEAAAS